jgi:HEAT repeat protein
MSAGTGSLGPFVLNACVTLAISGLASGLRAQEISTDADRSLIPQYAGKSVDQWTALLAQHLDGDTKEDKDRCQEAAGALGQLGPVAVGAVPLLVRAIQATAVDVRRPAIDALGRIGPAARSAVPAIVAEMDLPQDHINYAPLAHFRRLAAKALGRIGPGAGEAVPVLERALENEDPVYRVQAALALWRIRQDPRALPALQAALEQDDPEAPYEAVMAISAMGTAAESAVPALIATLDHRDPDVRRAAARVLTEFGPGVLSAVATRLRDDTPSDPSAAVYAVGELIGQLRREVFDDRQMETAALGQAARPVLQIAAPALIRLLSDPREQVRQVAIRALSQLGLLGVHVLLPVVESADPPARTAAIDALAQLEAFLPAQWPASDGMEVIKGKQIERLINLMQSTDPETRVAAFRLFDQLEFGSEAAAAIPLLRNALRDKNVSIRRYAFEALERLREG